MAQWVDIRKVRESVSIEQILEYYGLEYNLIRKGDQLIGPCPIHKGTNKSQFHISLNKNIFRCFGDCSSNPLLRNGGGNLIDLVCCLEGIEEQDDPDRHKAARKAALLVADWFGIDGTKPQSTPRVPKVAPAVSVPAPFTAETPPAVPATPEPLVNSPLKFALQDLDAGHPYLTERGFTPETIAYFGIGYHAGRGIMQGRIAIPIHDMEGTLVAYAGRWPGQEPPEGQGKYRLPNGFHKSILVYNLQRAKACARQHGLVLVEGFFDVMRLHQLGVCHAVAIMGSTLSETQEELIVQTIGPQGKVTLLFDGDASGRACTEDVLARLSTRVYTKALWLPDGQQPDQLTKAELKNLGR